MNSLLTKGALAIGLLAGVAFIPLPTYALDDEADVDVDVPGASVEIERDRLGILPSLLDDPDEDEYVEDEDDDDVPPGASVEILPD